MKQLLPLAVRIKAIGYFADGLLINSAGIGKWKCVEASCLYIDRSVFERTSSSKSPLDMNSTGQYSKQKGI